MSVWWTAAHSCAYIRGEAEQRLGSEWPPRWLHRLGRRDATQAQRLQARLEDDLLVVFNGRVQPVDVQVARRTARLHPPDSRSERDALIAATAIMHGLTVVTRNVADFEPLEVSLINPWVGSRS